MPNTSFWRPGLRVLGNDNPVYYQGHKIRERSIELGTVIATFINKRYPSLATGNHIAIYLGQRENYIDVIDQWIDHKTGKPQYAHRRNIYIKAGSISNNAAAFSIVYTLTGGY